MRRGLADPVPPSLAAAPDRHVAIVIADPSLRGVPASLRRWPGTVTTCDIDALAAARPDAVVLVADCAAPAGMAELRRVHRDVPDARLVVVGRDDRRANAARQALNAGADAFVGAHEVDRALRPALDAVLAGLVCAPRAARRLVAKPTFSHREKEVLELVVAGLTSREIAARLYLAESTIKTHLASACAKLGVRSRKDAVALLLDPDEGLAPIALPPAVHV